MSVAFRRDGDDEHKEPKFELPIPPGPNLVTARGLAQIQARVAALEAAIAENLKAPQNAPATAFDPVNPAAALMRDLRYWRTRLATAQPMPVPEPGEVAFGVRVRFRLNGADRSIDIVGDDEAEPTEGRLAFSAPLVRAMMGAEPGERVDFGGEAGAIEIVEAGPIPD